jgi:hypothetical protein
MNETLILTGSDLETLNRLIGEVPHKYAVPLVQFLNARLQNNRMPQARAGIHSVSPTKIPAAKEQTPPSDPAS